MRRRALINVRAVLFLFKTLSIYSAHSEEIPTMETRESLPLWFAGAMGPHCKYFYANWNCSPPMSDIISPWLMFCFIYIPHLQTCDHWHFNKINSPNYVEFFQLIGWEARGLFYRISRIKHTILNFKSTKLKQSVFESFSILSVKSQIFWYNFGNQQQCGRWKHIKTSRDVATSQG